MNYCPKQYRDSLRKQLPYTIDLVIPGCEKSCPKGQAETYAPKVIESEEWYHYFIDRIVEAINKKKFFPVCRIADGELILMFGEVLYDVRDNLTTRLRSYLSYMKRSILKKDYVAYTGNLYHSGQYSLNEISEIRDELKHSLVSIFNKGMVGCTTFSTHAPFTEKYFPIFASFLETNNIKLSLENYFPVYYMYVALIGKRSKEIIENRRLLIINGFSEQKFSNIKSSLLNTGALSVDWIKISENRSYYDKINADQYINKVDLVLVGAGVAKAKIFQQLKNLSVPCLDAGYIFEVWNDPSKGKLRPFCSLD